MRTQPFLEGPISCLAQLSPPTPRRHREEEEGQSLHLCILPPCTAGPAEPSQRTEPEVVTLDAAAIKAPPEPQGSQRGRL